MRKPPPTEWRGTGPLENIKQQGVNMLMLNRSVFALYIIAESTDRIHGVPTGVWRITAKESADATACVLPSDCPKGRATIALVYQAGIANVFAVGQYHSKPDVRLRTKRLLQADFRSCEMFARGMAEMGADVRSFACNMAGDITDMEWSDNLKDAPFSDQFRPVNTQA